MHAILYGAAKRSTSQNFYNGSGNETHFHESGGNTTCPGNSRDNCRFARC